MEGWKIGRMVQRQRWHAPRGAGSSFRFSVFGGKGSASSHAVSGTGRSDVATAAGTGRMEWWRDGRMVQRHKLDCAGMVLFCKTKH